jgi:hypothetical protein
MAAFHSEVKKEGYFMWEVPEANVTGLSELLSEQVIGFQRYSSLIS